MNYIGVSELKQTKRMWKMLDSEGELVLTKEGKPGAVILAVTPEPQSAKEDRHPPPPQIP